jgi:hypothetical protein
MAYDTKLAEKIREYLNDATSLAVEEKEMFRGVTFMVDGKMCVCVSGEKLMCRFNPNMQDEVAAKNAVEPLMMKGKQYKGYCYVSPEGFKAKKDFKFWIDLCLDYNSQARAAKKSAKHKTQ